MDTLLLILKYVAQGSIILGGALWIYWFQYTEEGKRLWKTKIRKLNMQETDEQEKDVYTSKPNTIIGTIQNRTRLFKLSLSLLGVFFISLGIMTIIALLT